MLPEFTRVGRTPAKLQAVKGSPISQQLPGSTIHATQDKAATLEVQAYRHPLFQIGYRILRFLRTFQWTLQEKNTHIRMEAVIEGELPARSPKGKAIVLKAGEYHLSVHSAITHLFKRDSACHYFVTHYSPELLQQIGISEEVKPSQVKRLTQEMSRLIQSIRRNPYQGKLLNFHHDNCIRELLKLHLLNELPTLPAELTDSDIQAIYAADQLQQKDLTVHDDIPTLAKKVGVNEQQLKKGYQQEFCMGVFERLTYHRMEHAKVLLATTFKTIDAIASLVGYGTRNSFITAFKKKFRTTPKQWRMKSKASL